MENIGKEMNKRRRKGIRKEYKVKKDLEKEGFIVVRSAGSHSPIDLIAIHPLLHVIKFIQCKAGDFPESEKKKLEEESRWMNNPFRGEFEVR